MTRRSRNSNSIMLNTVVDTNNKSQFTITFPFWFQRQTTESKICNVRYVRIHALYCTMLYCTVRALTASVQFKLSDMSVVPMHDRWKWNTGHSLIWNYMSLSLPLSDMSASLCIFSISISIYISIYVSFFLLTQVRGSAFKTLIIFMYFFYFMLVSHIQNSAVNT